MAAIPESVTYVLIFNQSDFIQLNDPNYKQALYVHGMTDIVLLAMLVIIAFLCNIIVVITVASHYYLRKLPFYVLLLLLSCIFLIDCIFNGSLSLAYMSQIIWKMGKSTCQTNVFAIQLVMAMVPWLIIQAAIDRYVCFRHPAIYRQHLTVRWQVASMGTVIVLTTLTVLPYLIKFLPVNAFPARMACGATNVTTSHSAYIYVTVLLVLQIIIPGVTILAFSVFFAQALISSHREKQRVQVSSWLQKEDMSMTSTAKLMLSHHDTRTLYVWLVMSSYYAAAILPYALLSIVQQMSPSMAENETRDQEVCNTPNTDAFLAWMRYLATWVHPVAVLSLLEDIRQEMLVLLTSWKSTSIMPDPEILPTTNYGSAHSKWNAFGLFHRDVGDHHVQADDLTAVLFPSPDGLFLRHPIGGCATQFDYSICDNFSECCFYEKKVLADLQNGVRRAGHRSTEGIKAVKVISEEYVNMKLRPSRKSHSKTLPFHSDQKSRGRALHMPKYPSSKVAPKTVRGSREPAIIRAEPIVPRTKSQRK